MLYNMFLNLHELAKESTFAAVILKQSFYLKKKLVPSRNTLRRDFTVM